MGQLLTLHDVHFVKDDSPSDISVVDMRGEVPSMGELDTLVPDLMPTGLSAWSPLIESPSGPPVDSPPITTPLPTPSDAPAASVKSRSLKWDNLPPHDHPT
jgi:hypothetical protein